MLGSLARMIVWPVGEQAKEEMKDRSLSLGLTLSLLLARQLMLTLDQIDSCSCTRS